MCLNDVGPQEVREEFESFAPEVQRWLFSYPGGE